MGANNERDCRAEFSRAMPEKPWPQGNGADTQAYEPLINRIDTRTQSDLFRRQGDKYSQTGDFYEMAKELDKDDKLTGKKTFANGVSVEMEQYDGWPTKLVLEDKQGGLKETVTLNERTHIIETDKVEYCGVSRQRRFGEHGENYRAYTFPGGILEKEGGPPEVTLDKGHVKARTKLEK